MDLFSQPFGNTAQKTFRPLFLPGNELKERVPGADQIFKFFFLFEAHG